VTTTSSSPFPAAEFWSVAVSAKPGDPADSAHAPMTSADPNNRAFISFSLSLLQIAKQAQETPDERAMMPAEVLPANEY
jgi:hypothetical protein